MDRYDKYDIDWSLFDRDQKEQIWLGIKADLSQEELSLLANPNLNRFQMKEVLEGLIELTKEQVQVFAKPEYNFMHMNDIRIAFLDHLDFAQISLITDPNLDAYQRILIRTGIDEGLSVEQIKIYANPILKLNQMNQIRIGFKHGLPLEQVELYADAKFDYKQMQEIRERLELASPTKNEQVISNEFLNFQEKVRELQKDGLFGHPYDSDSIRFDFDKEESLYHAFYQPNYPNNSVYDMEIQKDLGQDSWFYKDVKSVEFSDDKMPIFNYGSNDHSLPFEDFKESLEKREFLNVLNLVSNGFFDVLEPEIMDCWNDSKQIHFILEKKDFGGGQVRASSGIGCAVLRYVPSDDFIKEELGDDEWEVPILCVELFDYDDYNDTIEDINKMSICWNPCYGYNSCDYPQLNEALQGYMADCRSMMQEELWFYENRIKEKELSKE